MSPLLLLHPPEGADRPGLTDLLLHLQQQLPQLQTHPLQRVLPDLQGRQVLLVGDLRFVTDCATNFPQLLEDPHWATAYVDQPNGALDPQEVAAQLATLERYPRLICSSGITRGLLISAAERPHRRTAERARVIRPLPDLRVYRPVDGYHREYDRAEIRQELLPNLTDDQPLVMGRILDHQTDDLPGWLTTVQLMQQQLPELRVLLWVDRPSTQTRQLLQLAEVQNLTVRPDWTALTVDDQNLVFNAADLLLSCSGCLHWPIWLAQGMASGCLVATPQDHHQLELVDQQRGVELPCPTLRLTDQVLRHTCPALNSQILLPLLERRREYARTAREWLLRQPRPDQLWAEIFG